MRWLAVGLFVCVLPVSPGFAREPGQQSFGTSMPYSVGRALPDRSGDWTRAGQIQMVKPGDLWEHINGAAEQFLTYGFQDLATTRYTDRAAGTVVVAEIYRMADAVNAFGIYRQEVSPKARSVALGVEGRASSNTLKFWLGAFFVKLTLPPGSGKMPELEALGAAIAKGIGAAGKMPAEVGWFPSAGQLPDSVRYVPADALGQAAFTNAFEAKYENPGEPSTVIVVPFGSDTAAAAALARYESFLSRAKGKTKVAAPGDGGFSATDSFQGFILAVRAGSRLVISLGSSDERAVTARLNEVIKRLPAVPVGQPRKDGVS
jgi:hypothetical protein